MASRYFVKLRPPGERWYVVRDRNDPNLWMLALSHQKPESMSFDEAERLRVLASQALAGKVEVVPAF